MLTFLGRKAKFSPVMVKSFIKFSLLVGGIFLLQSCYTLITPPATTPYTTTTVTSAPAMASTVGGVGAYGWDPYWEPTLPFTSYHRGYGASYYSPYNYYDYNHAYYTPVYVVGEVRDPEPARDFNRDDNLGGSRNRERLPEPVVSSARSSSGTAIGSGVSVAAPAIIAPVKPTPVKPRPVSTIPSKPSVSKPREASRPKVETKPIKVNRSKPVEKKQESKTSDPPASKKRTRTRK